MKTCLKSDVLLFNLSFLTIGYSVPGYFKIRKMIGELFKGKICQLCIVAILLGLHILIALTSIIDKSNTWDETGHLTSGYVIWKYNDYRFNAEGGNFFQRLAALPLLSMDLKFPEDSKAWQNSDLFTLAYEFFYRTGNPPEQMLWWGRAVNVGFSVLLGIIVYLWSVRLFGSFGGVFSLFLYVLSPTVLAHGRLATVDLLLTCLMLITLGMLWRVMHRITLTRMALLGICSSFLFLTKFSSLLFFPVAFLLFACRIVYGKPLVLRWPSLGRGMLNKRIRSRGGIAGIICITAFLMVVVNYMTIWTFYGFRYEVADEFETESASLYRPWEDMIEGSGRFRDVIQIMADNHFLPRSYLYGLAYTLNMSKQRRSFLFGQYSVTGFRSFFPAMFALKTPVISLLLIWVSAGTIFWHFKKRRRLPHFLYVSAPLLLFFIIYAYTALSTNLNIGHRHILPLYPVLFVFCGALAYFKIQNKWMRHLLPALMFFYIIETQSIYPHYLSFFNILSGGPSEAHRIAVDSSLDWGQDLPAVKSWIANHPDEKPFYLSYFGTSSPDFYGLDVRLLPGYVTFDKKNIDIASLKAGTYLISATQLKNVYGVYFGDWKEKWEHDYLELRDIARRYRELMKDPKEAGQFISRFGHGKFAQMMQTYESLRFAILCKFLNTKEPDDIIANTVLVYRLTESDIEEYSVFNP
jgi:hypothetical protein